MMRVMPTHTTQLCLNTETGDVLPWKAATLREMRNFRLELDVWRRFWMSLLAASWYFSSIFLVQQVRFFDMHTWRSEPKCQWDKKLRFLTHSIKKKKTLGRMGAYCLTNKDSFFPPISVWDLTVLVFAPCVFILESVPPRIHHNRNIWKTETVFFNIGLISGLISRILKHSLLK